MNDRFVLFGAAHLSAIALAFLVPAALATATVMSPDPRFEARLRADRRTWLEAHGYRVIEVTAAEAERDVGKVLDDLAEVVSAL